ncbi:MAG: Lacal_2735 family protein [Vicingaceae bacterium]|nr:Lacal_2735 family protein [Vicingaceae bacterium]
MFNIFKKKSPLDKLEEAYSKALKEAHELSTVNRKASDIKTAEANSILDQIDAIKKTL